MYFSTFFRGILLSVLIASAALANGNTKTLNFDGVAKNNKGEIVYLESHVAKFDGDKVQTSVTTYFDVDKKIIAELKSDYKKSLFLPDYTFNDFRNGMEHVVELKEGKLYVKARKKTDAKVETKEFETKDNMISGQGFHYYIREHLAQFMEDKDKDVRFVMPGLLDSFSFNIWPTREPAAVVPAENVITLKMAVNSWVLKIFVSQITMTYDKVKKYLLTYQGISNLETLDGKTQDVNISYTYN